MLRPLSELQIASIFSGMPEFFQHFKSCNVGSKTDTWCGLCPKCLFTFIILSPFLKPETLIGIFGHNLLDDPSLEKIFDELTGKTDIKPFECIGTVDEVNAALNEAVKMYDKDESPLFTEDISATRHVDKYSSPGDIQERLNKVGVRSLCTGQVHELTSKGTRMIKLLSSLLANRKLLILGFGREGQSTFRYITEAFPGDHQLALPTVTLIYLRNCRSILSEPGFPIHLGEYYLESLIELPAYH